MLLLALCLSPCVGPSAGYIIGGLIVPAASNPDLGTWPTALSACSLRFPLFQKKKISFFLRSFLSSCVSFFSFRSFFSFECAYKNTMDTFKVIWLHEIRDGAPQLVSTASLTDWYDTAVRTASCLFVFSHRDARLFTAYSCDHSQDLREVS